MANCCACGNALREGTRFCAKCGMKQATLPGVRAVAPHSALEKTETAAVAAAAEPDSCPKCGKTLLPESQNCWACGAVLQTTTALAPPLLPGTLPPLPVVDSTQGSLLQRSPTVVLVSIICLTAALLVTVYILVHRSKYIAPPSPVADTYQGKQKEEVIKQRGGPPPEAPPTPQNPPDLRSRNQLAVRQNAPKVQPLVNSADVITRRVTNIRRYRTAQQLLDAIGRVTYPLDVSLNVSGMPVGQGPEEVNLHYFRLNRRFFVSDLAGEYRARGLTPDPQAQAADNEQDAAFADGHPNMGYWQESPQRWCSIQFLRYVGKPSVMVYCGNIGSVGTWWLAGVRQ